MRVIVYVAAAVLAVVFLAMAACCSGAADRNHLSPWWLPTYGSLIASFALVAFGTAPLSS